MWCIILTIDDYFVSKFNFKLVEQWLILESIKIYWNILLHMMSRKTNYRKCMKGYIHYVNESFAIKLFMCDYRLISKKYFSTGISNKKKLHVLYKYLAYQFKIE